MASRKAFLVAAAAMAVVVGGLLSAATAWPTPNMVTWTLNVDYNQWVQATYNGQIPVGEALEFVYNRDDHDVVMLPDKASFDAYDATRAVETWNTGSDIVELSDYGDGDYYFICGVANHCIQGMKLNITLCDLIR